MAGGRGSVSLVFGAAFVVFVVTAAEDVGALEDDVMVTRVLDAAGADDDGEALVEASLLAESVREAEDALASLLEEAGEGDAVDAATSVLEGLASLLW